ncbi:MAG: PLP-dependent aminotransferase family protein [Euryarchaeota archaeon]|nr:PLP-dependent aminotransferase family protein [Euryarchaeota archaeon]
MVQSFSHLFSERARGMRASEIRELLKLTQRPEIISFAGGLPNPEAFPIKDIKNITDDLLTKRGPQVLQYGTTEGVTELREALAARLKRDKGIDGDLKNILITSGSQQGLDLFSKVFIDPHDIIIVSAPTYLGGTNAFASYQAQMESVPLDEQGMIPDLLEERLWKLHRHGKNSKMIYIIPTFQNPAGVTISESRRKKILDVVANLDMLVVEDDPYSELRFDGDDVRSMKALDKEDRVIYLGTFSKILAPGFRCAWLVASEEICQKLTVAKQSTDLCTNTFGQYVAYEYIARKMVDRHILLIRKMYKRKRDIMLKAFARYFPKGVTWTKPEGGMFAWVTTPPAVDTKVMFDQAIANNVAYVVGTAFYPMASGGRNSMRLNFTHPTDEKIEEGVKRLGSVIEAEIGATSGKRRGIQRQRNGIISGV